LLESTAIDPSPVTAIMAFPVALSESLSEGSRRKIELAPAWVGTARDSSASTVNRGDGRRRCLDPGSLGDRPIRAGSLRGETCWDIGLPPSVLELGGTQHCQSVRNPLTKSGGPSGLTVLRTTEFEHRGLRASRESGISERPGRERLS